MKNMQAALDFRELFLIQHARAHTAEVGGADLSVQDNILRDLTDDQIRSSPQPGFNSLAWLIWHMTRTEDFGANFILAGRPQVFAEGGWAGKMNILHRYLGSGMTEQEVAEFNQRINVPALIAYRAAVGRRTQEILRVLSPEVLGEVIDVNLIQRMRDAGAFGPHAEWVTARWQGKRKAFILTHTVLGHAFLHWGQGEIVRGLLGFPSL